MLKQQLTQEEVVTLSVVYDAETTTHTRRSCYLFVVYDAETTIHKVVTLTTTTTPGARINHRYCVNHVAETVRTQIPLLKQPTICDAETTYNNSNKKINK
jgi:hypothetical protein